MKSRKRNLYSTEAEFKLSRSKLELFINCPRCFYIDRKLGVSQPDGYAFSLNIAVDSLLKKEFDKYRTEQMPHPLFIENNLQVLPFIHEKMDEWRDSLHHGVQYQVPNTNIILTGGIDDLWIDITTQELIVVDYKATSKSGIITLDADWQVGYKRQAEIYQWLLRKNNFKVSNTAYFVYANAKKDCDSFNNKLEFDTRLIAYNGNDSWVEKAVQESYQALCSATVPLSGAACKLCNYGRLSQIALNNKSTY